MPGTSGHCCRYVCPPTPCPTYQRELGARGKARCSLTNRRGEGFCSALTRSWLTLACFDRRRWCEHAPAYTQHILALPWAHCTPEPAPLPAPRGHHSSPTCCTHHFRQQFPFPISSLFFSPTLFYYSASALVLALQICRNTDADFSHSTRKCRWYRNRSTHAGQSSCTTLS